MAILPSWRAGLPAESAPGATFFLMISAPTLEIERDKVRWRTPTKIAHVWHRLFRAVRIAGDRRQVSESPLPASTACSLRRQPLIILRRVASPIRAQSGPGKPEGAIDLAYFDNARKQWWKPTSGGWHHCEEWPQSFRAITIWLNRGRARDSCRWCSTGTTTSSCSSLRCGDRLRIAVTRSSRHPKGLDCRSPAACTAACIICRFRLAVVQGAIGKTVELPATRSSRRSTSWSPSRRQLPIRRRSCARSSAEIAKDEIDNLDEHAAPPMRSPSSPSQPARPRSAVRVPTTTARPPACCTRITSLFWLWRPRLPPRLAFIEVEG